MIQHAAPIVLPDLGIDGGPARVSAWLAEPGEDVLSGDRVVEVLLPGMTFDVSAPVSGTLRSVSKPVDALVFAGDVLGVIWAADEQEAGA